MIKMCKPETEIPPLYGISDFAKKIGWSRQKASVYYSRNKLPEPATYAGGKRPFWTLKQIKEWSKKVNDTSVSFNSNKISLSKENLSLFESTFDRSPTEIDLMLLSETGASEELISEAIKETKAENKGISYTVKLLLNWVD